MDNPEKLATLGKQDTGRRKKNQKHNTETTPLAICLYTFLLLIFQFNYHKNKA
jgi:hypothetical protein